MSDIAIRVENLSKQYPFDRLRAGCIGGPSTGLRTGLGMKRKVI